MSSKTKTKKADETRAADLRKKASAGGRLQPASYRLPVLSDGNAQGDDAKALIDRAVRGKGGLDRGPPSVEGHECLVHERAKLVPAAR